MIVLPAEPQPQAAIRAAVEVLWDQLRAASAAERPAIEAQIRALADRARALAAYQEI